VNCLVEIQSEVTVFHISKKLKGKIIMYIVVNYTLWLLNEINNPEHCLKLEAMT